jgi:hypothetical protein
MRKLTDLQKKRLNRTIVALIALAIPVFGLSRPGLAWTAEDRPITGAAIEFASDLIRGNRPVTRFVHEIVSQDDAVQWLTGELDPYAEAVTSQGIDQAIDMAER